MAYVNLLYCDNHNIYVCQIITLYTLNLHNAIGLLYLNKVRKNPFAFTILPAFGYITKTYSIVFLFFYCGDMVVKVGW